MSQHVTLTARALLFDMDGVLVDSIASIEGHWRRWAERHGLDPEALLKDIHGRRAVDTIRAALPELDAEREVAALALRQAADTAGVVAMPGAAALLPRLPEAGWAVVTSAVGAVARARLRAAGLPLPAVLVAADDIGRGKPDPEGYLAAAARLGVAPAECVVVEDAPVGVAAARAGGMLSVGLATTYPAGSLAGADLVVASLAALDVRLSPVPGAGPTYTLWRAAEPADSQ